MVMMAATRRRAWAPPEAGVEDTKERVAKMCSEHEEDEEEEPCGEDEVPDFEAKVKALVLDVLARLTDQCCVCWVCRPRSAPVWVTGD